MRPKVKDEVEPNLLKIEEIEELRKERRSINANQAESRRNIWIQHVKDNPEFI